MNKKILSGMIFLGIITFIQSAYPASKLGECYVKVNVNNTFLPNGYKWQLYYQDPGATKWYIGGSGDSTDTYYKQSPYWYNKNVNWKVEVKKDYTTVISTQTNVCYAGSDTVSFTVSAPTPTPTPTNPTPTVSLTSPSIGTNLNLGGALTLSANASDRTSTGAAGVISKVEFFSGNTSLGVDTTAPYSIVWKPAATGNYILTARATDSQGAIGTSQSIALRVVAAPTIPTITTIAGNGISGYADGSGNTARFNGPSAIAVHSNGNIYVADTNNNRIRKITNTGIVSTIAGSGAKSFGDGTGIAASFNSPTGIAVDANENIYVADSGNNRIRKITPNGVVTTLWYGTSSTSQPFGVILDASGNIYITDKVNHRIQKFNIK
jgi:hypothetical protein